MFKVTLRNGFGYGCLRPPATGGERVCLSVSETVRESDDKRDELGRESKGGFWSGRKGEIEVG